MGKIPHFLCVPLPIQGHVNPLMRFSEVLVKHGCKVTFVHTEFNLKRVKDNIEGSQIKVVALPDGLDPEDDRSDVMKAMVSIRRTMPSRLHKLIQDINALDGECEISCVMVTVSMGWALEVAHRLGIKGAVLCQASATSLASAACIPSLIQDGIIDSQGHPTKKQEIQLSPNMPLIDTHNFFWIGIEKEFFDHLVEEMQTLELLGEWWLCNTTYDLEPGVFSISPKFLPIGPLVESDSNTSSLWQEDITCLDWLDQQQPQSVIYVSFGSLAVLKPNQFKELALALDLLNKPFLWVVRSNSKDNNAYPDEFRGSKGKIVDWAPQRKVLNHPAIACFISHCGWNSTTEGVYSGIPFLCWPFEKDQFVNKSYICDEWNVGVGLDKDENGLVSKEEIRQKMEQLLGDDSIKARSLKLKEKSMSNIVECGPSSRNLHMFINWAK